MTREQCMVDFNRYGAAYISPECQALLGVGGGGGGGGTSDGRERDRAQSDYNRTGLPQIVIPPPDPGTWGVAPDLNRPPTQATEDPLLAGSSWWKPPTDAAGKQCFGCWLKDNASWLLLIVAVATYLKIRKP